ncbi:MAG: DUF1015 domain-containing protein [Oscillospiraceae bacterium]|jgi:hypothetical protein|nr:DUF1015 domain-containing protein [Oscillospiraceae bacterium]
MDGNIFRPADILLPSNINLQNWAVIACDQYSSEREYWTRADLLIGSSPSTLRMMIPEAYLTAPNLAARERAAGLAADAYLESGIFREYPNCFVYVERTLRDGRVRRGLVGALDLEAYDYSGAGSPIRATEETVPERLPPRARARKSSPLELTHIMAFIDDEAKAIIEPLADSELPRLYDFKLMENSGSLRGFLVGSVPAREISDAVSALPGGIKIGDGNHSLAAAKLLWEEIKPTLSERERETCPARFALAELCNVYGDAIDFHPIHRAVFGVKTERFIDGLAAAISGNGRHTIKCLAAEIDATHVQRISEKELRAGDMPIGELIAAVQRYIDDYFRGVRKRSGFSVDYIHGEKSLRSVAAAPDCVGIELPAMEKAELFRALRGGGDGDSVLPRKSFSIGEAWDKRFYMECRRIK